MYNAQLLLHPCYLGRLKILFRHVCFTDELSVNENTAVLKAGKVWGALRGME